MDKNQNSMIEKTKKWDLVSPLDNSPLPSISGPIIAFITINPKRPQALFQSFGRFGRACVIVSQILRQAESIWFECSCRSATAASAACSSASIASKQTFIARERMLGSIVRHYSIQTGTLLEPSMRSLAKSSRVRNSWF